MVAWRAVVSIVIAGCGWGCASSAPPSASRRGGDPSGAGDGGVASAFEPCDDGLDGDDDGAIDEGCVCTLGTTQPCWPGPAELRETGGCRDGVQTCAGSVEFPGWGVCEGATLDATCDGSDDGGGSGSGDPGGDPGGGGGGCSLEIVPDLLVVLDRTQSMHKTPAGATPTDPTRSKWYLAIQALERVLPSFDSTLRFGLELFPQGGARCVTLEERLSGIMATNTICQPGDVIVAPGAHTATAIADAIDPYTTTLCNSTPIGLAVQTAGETLRAARTSGRSQHVLLITDGQETCMSAPIEHVQQLWLEGVRTFVVAFSGSLGIDGPRLNNLACAGHTAPSFGSSCIDQGGGHFVARNPDGSRLFYLVGDAPALESSLRAIAGTVDCTP